MLFLYADFLQVTRIVTQAYFVHQNTCVILAKKFQNNHYGCIAEPLCRAYGFFFFPSWESVSTLIRRLLTAVWVARATRMDWLFVSAQNMRTAEHKNCLNHRQLTSATCFDIRAFYILRAVWVSLNSEWLTVKQERSVSLIMISSFI